MPDDDDDEQLKDDSTPTAAFSPSRSYTSSSPTLKEITSASYLLQKVQDSLHFAQPDRCCIPTVSAAQVEIGALLGAGSFSQVFQVTIVDEAAVTRLQLPLQASSRQQSYSNKRSSTSNLSSCCNNSSHHGSSGGSPKFALKRVLDGNDPVLCALSVKDAYTEVEVLLHLPAHVHICRLVALGDTFWHNPATSFVLLERVAETLKHRLVHWKRREQQQQQQQQQHQGLAWLLLLFRRRCKKLKRFHNQRQRLRVAGLGVAAALQHLHAHGICYRDLKPSNVGFDHAGVLKLFDFGLARTVMRPTAVGIMEQSTKFHDNSDDTNDSVHGTARYMAPEIARGDVDVSTAADVHSFAILAWEICTLQRPYGTCTSLEQLSNRSVQQHDRPSLRPIADKAVRQLLQACWHPDAAARPNMVTLLTALRHIVGQENDEDDGTTLEE